VAAPASASFVSALVSWYEDSNLAARGAGYVEITCSDSRCFKSWSASELSKMIDSLPLAAARVAAGTLTIAKFLELQQMIGINHNPLGLVANTRLRGHVDIIGVMTYDWVHNCLQDGVFNQECRAFLKACGPLGVTREGIQAFLADEGWVFPACNRSKAKQFHRVFDAHRQSDKEPDKVKAGCSEMLGLYGLLRYFFELYVGDNAAVRVQYRSFLAVCRVLDLVLMAKRCIADFAAVAAQLQIATEEHLQLSGE
jgi:hypothetical protein